MFTIVLSPPKDLCKNLPDAIDKCFMNKMAFLFMLFRFANREGSTRIVPWIVDVTSTPIKDDEGKDTGKSKLTLVVNIGVEDGKRTVSAPETAVELESDPFWMTGCQHAIKSALDEIRKNTPNRKDEKGRKVGYNDWTDAEKDAYFNALLALHKAFLKCEFKDGSGDLEHFLEFRITNEKLYTMYRRMGILRSDGFGENNDFEKSLAEIMKEVKARISRLKNQ
jgi:hypothetical protein